MKNLAITQSQLEAALTEWMRRWQEDPAKFLSEAESLAQSPKTYGEEAAPYLIKILEEQKK